MRNNQIFVVILCVLLVVAILIGIVYSVVFKRSEQPEEPTAPSEDMTNREPETTGGIHIEHTPGESVIEFDDGNEIFFDTSLVPYLERMEFGVPAVDNDGNYYFDSDGDIVYDKSKEKDLEPVLDNLILLINHYAKLGYSIDANRQIQRFYVMYYDRFMETPFDELTERITKCFPSEGADAETLYKTVIEVFGFQRGDNFAFVFNPISVAEIKVQFYNVCPKAAVIDEELEHLCIYNNWHSEEDDGYERNLEGWLQNVIKTVDEVGLSEEKIILAQILYAGSLADAEYRPDWNDVLIRCLTIEDWSYDAFKLSVEAGFGVCIDYNVPLMEYFESISEVGG